MLEAGSILRTAADTFDERNKTYGENFRAVGRVMKALFPEGIGMLTEDDHNRFHIFMLCVVKLTRYAQNYHQGGHLDSAVDSSVYWAMLAAIDQEIDEAIAKP